MSWTETVGRMQDDVLDIFAEMVTYDPKDSAPFQVEADFHRPHELIDLDGAVPVTGTRPFLWVKLSDFPAGVDPKQQDGVTRSNGETYEVSDVQPDGHGMAKLMLIEK